MGIGAIVQARFSSMRLPGKILRYLPYTSGITVLEQVIRRLKRSKRLDKIIIATTAEKNVSGIIKIAKRERVEYFKGDPENVLLRYYLAAKKHGLDIIVRITSDCPCLDPEIIDMVIEKHMRGKADYTSNTIKRTFARGLDVEVFNFNILEKAYKNSRKDYEKEHVTPYIYENPALFKLNSVQAPPGLFGPDIRLTLDTKEDYALLCLIYDYLYPGNRYFTAYEVMRLFKNRPWLKLINKKVVQKKLYD